ncbi:MAG: hypothetical protein Fur0037_11020 [Planctomycetota bacterium]
MVKKSSIFARLAERFRSSGGVRVSPREGGKAEPGRASVRRVEGNGSSLPAQRGGELKTTKKLSDREEAMVVLGEHFAELASLLRGSHGRLDAQTQKLAEAADSLKQLPALGKGQLELLQGLAQHMERQNQLGTKVAETLGSLPKLLGSVEAALSRAAAADERTATTIREFQSTMERIQNSMGSIVEHSEKQANAAQALADRREESLKSLAEDLGKAQRETVQELRAVQDESMKSLRRAHEDQSNRLQRVVQENAGWNKAVLVMLGLVLVALLGLLVVQLVK